MNCKEKKIVIALRKYYTYLKARFLFIDLAILDVTDAEYKRMSDSRKLYKEQFIKTAGFKDWLLKKNHIARKQAVGGIDKFYYGIALKLKDDILRSEK